jgi:hypothetical protein
MRPLPPLALARLLLLGSRHKLGLLLFLWSLLRCRRLTEAGFVATVCCLIGVGRQQATRESPHDVLMEDYLNGLWRLWGVSDHAAAVGRIDAVLGLLMTLGALRFVGAGAVWASTMAAGQGGYLRTLVDEGFLALDTSTGRWRNEKLRIRFVVEV